MPATTTISNPPTAPAKGAAPAATGAAELFAALLATGAPTDAAQADDPAARPDGVAPLSDEAPEKDDADAAALLPLIDQQMLMQPQVVPAMVPPVQPVSAEENKLVPAAEAPAISPDKTTPVSRPLLPEKVSAPVRGDPDGPAAEAARSNSQPPVAKEPVSRSLPTKKDGVPEARPVLPDAETVADAAVAPARSAAPNPASAPEAAPFAVRIDAASQSGLPTTAPAAPPQPAPVPATPATATAVPAPIQAEWKRLDRTSAAVADPAPAPGRPAGETSAVAAAQPPAPAPADLAAPAQAPAAAPASVPAARDPADGTEVEPRSGIGTAVRGAIKAVLDGAKTIVTPAAVQAPPSVVQPAMIAPAPEAPGTGAEEAAAVEMNADPAPARAATARAPVAPQQAAPGQSAKAATPKRVEAITQAVASDKPVDTSGPQPDAVIQPPPAVQNGVAATAVAAPVPQPVAAALNDKVLDMSRDGVWIDQLARDIASTSGTDGTMRFRLTPENLGALKVEITQSDQGAHVRLHVSSEAAQQVLADAKPRLAAEARAQGIRIADTQVSFTGGGAQAQQQGDGARQRAQNAQQDVPLRTVRATASTTNPSAPADTSRRSDRYA